MKKYIKSSDEKNISLGSKEYARDLYYNALACDLDESPDYCRGVVDGIEALFGSFIQEDQFRTDL